MKLIVCCECPGEAVDDCDKCRTWIATLGDLESWDCVNCGRHYAVVDGQWERVYHLRARRVDQHAMPMNGDYTVTTGQIAVRIGGPET